MVTMSLHLIEINSCISKFQTDKSIKLITSDLCAHVWQSLSRQGLTRSLGKAHLRILSHGNFANNLNDALIYGEHGGALTGLAV